MKASVCITTYNEEENIAALLDSLASQSKKPDEIIIVDGGSSDKTPEIIRHYQKKFSYIKTVFEKCSRSRGRNISVDLARNEVVAMTDAGCTADTDWLKNITHPFTCTSRVHVVAGFYRMTGDANIQKAMSVFLGVTPRNFNHNFLPSTRSMAFTKSAWEAVGGFPESEINSAEDTDFNYKAVKLGLKYSRVKNATVEWGMPETLKDFFNKVKDYAKWDVVYGIWWHPAQRLMSHNIKALSIFARYLLFLFLLIMSLTSYLSFAYLLICLFVYLAWAFRKEYAEFNDWKISLWGPFIQVISDFAVMSGFLSGIFSKK